MGLRQETNRYYTHQDSYFFNVPIVPSDRFVKDRNLPYAIAYSRWSDAARLDIEEPYLHLRDSFAFSISIINE